MAFDSVDHGYIERTLRKYGFGPHRIKYIKTLKKLFYIIKQNWQTQRAK